MIPSPQCCLTRMAGPTIQSRPYSYALEDCWTRMGWPSHSSGGGGALPVCTGGQHWSLPPATQPKPPVVLCPHCFQRVHGLSKALLGVTSRSLFKPGIAMAPQPVTDPGLVTVGLFPPWDDSLSLPGEPHHHRFSPPSATWTSIYISISMVWRYP